MSLRGRSHFHSWDSSDWRWKVLYGSHTCGCFSEALTEGRYNLLKKPPVNLHTLSSVLFLSERAHCGSKHNSLNSNCLKKKENGGGGCYCLSGMNCNVPRSAHWQPHFLSGIQSVWWIYWGSMVQLLRSQPFWRGWIRQLGPSSAGLAVVSWWDLFTISSECNPPHWSIDTLLAAGGSCCTTRTQNSP